MTQVDVHALAGAYALDALDDIERTAFGRHLAQCEACRLEVAELQATTARLADASWATPPPMLKEAVLGEIRRTRQAAPGRAERDVTPLARWRRWTAGAVAAGILAVAAATATYVVQDQRISQYEAIQAVLTAQDAQTKRMPVKGGGELTAVCSPSRNDCVVMLSGVEVPDPAHAYQFWLIENTVPAPAGTLAAGRGNAVHLIKGVRQADALAVSLERAGGASTPGDVRAQIPLT